jgi:hypothetical protein
MKWRMGMRVIRDRVCSSWGRITAWQGVNVGISWEGVWIIDTIKYRV